MFRWRKRNRGFEWSEYVRTTILVRRHDRRKRLDDLKLSAIGSAKAAGRDGAVAARYGLVAGARALFAALGTLALLPGRAIAAVWPRVAPPVMRAGSSGWSALSGALAPAVGRLGPLIDLLERPRLRFILLVAGTIAAIGTLSRLWLHGFDHEVAISATIAGLCLPLAALPALANRSLPVGLGAALRMAGSALLMPFAWLGSLLGGARGGVVAGGVLAAIAALALYLPGEATTGSGTTPVATGSLAAASPGGLEGRATAVSGDRLRLGGREVRLAGIEAPDLDQTCRRTSGLTWRCGDAARRALDRMVRGRRIECEVVGSNDIDEVRCTLDGADVAAGLVRAGHVFAAPGLFAAYSSHEEMAQSAKAGLWSGLAERPSDFRAKRWEEAKRSAPEGCPIKGQVSDRGRVYHLPWSPAYDRVKMRAAKGDRWFCSEKEAQEAGWKATERS